ncbi:hypothetical protein AAG570_012519 [Ranatra chinensis]|uniref:Reverse transcriptase domain-containing protein n=1 Tax=Ranatra chinensis TaxID=642074 RepID=A0ABD0YG07_9HEMI
MEVNFGDLVRQYDDRRRRYVWTVKEESGSSTEEEEGRGASSEGESSSGREKKKKKTTYAGVVNKRSSKRKKIDSVIGLPILEVPEWRGARILVDTGSTGTIMGEEIVGKLGKPRRYPVAFQEIIREHIKEMLDTGVLRESVSTFNSPLWVVPKKLDKSGVQKYRVVVDYRELNKRTKTEKYPIPRLEEMIDRMSGSEIFSVIDLKSGYLQIPMETRDIEKTSFQFERGKYEFVRMPFGLKNAPITFQRMIDGFLLGLDESFIQAYMDDLIIFSKQFKIKADHKPLVWVEKLEETSATISRWKETLAAYNFEIVHTRATLSATRHPSESEGTQSGPTSIHSEDTEHGKQFQVIETPSPGKISAPRRRQTPLLGIRRRPETRRASKNRRAPHHHYVVMTSYGDKRDLQTLIIELCNLRQNKLKPLEFHRKIQENLNLQVQYIRTHSSIEDRKTLLEQSQCLALRVFLKYLNRPLGDYISTRKPESLDVALHILTNDFNVAAQSDTVPFSQSTKTPVTDNQWSSAMKPKSPITPYHQPKFSPTGTCPTSKPYYTPIQQTAQRSTYPSTPHVSFRPKPRQIFQTPKLCTKDRQVDSCNIEHGLNETDNSAFAEESPDLTDYGEHDTSQHHDQHSGECSEQHFLEIAASEDTHTNY